MIKFLERVSPLITEIFRQRAEKGRITNYVGAAGFFALFGISVYFNYYLIMDRVKMVVVNRKCISLVEECAKFNEKMKVCQYQRQLALDIIDDKLDPVRPLEHPIEDIDDVKQELEQTKKATKEEAFTKNRKSMPESTQTPNKDKVKEAINRARGK